MSDVFCVGHGRETRGEFSPKVALEFGLLEDENISFGRVAPSCIRVKATQRTIVSAVQFYSLEDFKAMVETLHQFVHSPEFQALEFKEAVK